MRKNTVIIGIAFILMVAIESFFFRSFYYSQVVQQKNLLFKQSEVCAGEIERVIQKFESDLNYILFSDDIAGIFEQEESNGMRKLQLFYSTYNELIKNIDIYDNNKNVLNLFRDRKMNFITDSYIAQRQRELSSEEQVIIQNNEYLYILPVFKNNEAFANILVTINIHNFILAELEKFHLENYSWQWVIDVDNNQVYNAQGFKYKDFGKLDEINKNLDQELGSMVIHNLSTDSTAVKMLTVYAPITVMNKNFGIAMSVAFDAFINKIWQQMAIIAVSSLLIFLAVSIFLSRQVNSLKKKIAV